MTEYKTKKEIINEEIERVIYILTGFFASYVMGLFAFCVTLLITSFLIVIIKLSVRNYAMTKIDFELAIEKAKQKAEEQKLLNKEKIKKI